MSHNHKKNKNCQNRNYRSKKSRAAVKTDLALSQWLFEKHHLSFRTYQKMPKARRKELRQEFYYDTYRAAPQFYCNVS